jgi:hypothetical protein
MAETKPSWWKIALNALYSLLGGLKSAGVFSKGQGPDIKPK